MRQGWEREKDRKRGMVGGRKIGISIGKNKEYKKKKNLLYGCFKNNPQKN